MIVVLAVGFKCVQDHRAVVAARSLFKGMYCISILFGMKTSKVSPAGRELEEASLTELGANLAF